MLSQDESEPLEVASAGGWLTHTCCNSARCPLRTSTKLTRRPFNLVWDKCVLQVMLQELEPEAARPATYPLCCSL